jgi:hypothetical protein
MNKSGNTDIAVIAIIMILLIAGIAYLSWGMGEKEPANKQQKPSQAQNIVDESTESLVRTEMSATLAAGEAPTATQGEAPTATQGEAPTATQGEKPTAVEVVTGIPTAQIMSQAEMDTAWAKQDQTTIAELTATVPGKRNPLVEKLALLTATPFPNPDSLPTGCTLAPLLAKDRECKNCGCGVTNAHTFWFYGGDFFVIDGKELNPWSMYPDGGTNFQSNGDKPSWTVSCTDRDVILVVCPKQ